MQIYQVGGSVRDELLGMPVVDRDWVVVGSTPEQMLAQGYTPVGKDFPVFLHPETHEEYALARTERKSARGHKGFVCHSSPEVTIEQDLLRRDLTINAIAKDQQGNLIDPYHGIADIEAKILRHVSAAFTEDPLRVLRVARFHARFAHLGFKVAPKTKRLMTEMANNDELSELSAERIWQEIDKALHAQSPALFFKTLKTCKALAAIFPELEKAKYQALELAVTAQLSPLMRFALLAYQLDEAAFKTNPYLRKIPNEQQELSKLLIRFHKIVLSKKPLEPEALLNLFKQTDALRRKSRFEDFMVCCEIIAQTKKREFSALQYLMALQAIEDIDTAALMAQGLSGAKLGAAIDAERLKVLTEFQV